VKVKSRERRQRHFISGRKKSHKLSGPLLKHIRMLYKNSVGTSQQTHHASMTTVNRLMLFTEVIAVYCENHMENINTLCGQNAELFIGKTGGIYSNRGTR
jgi:hypothetical protein